MHMIKIINHIIVQVKFLMMNKYNYQSLTFDEIEDELRCQHNEEGVTNKPTAQNKPNESDEQKETTEAKTTNISPLPDVPDKPKESTIPVVPNKPNDQPITNKPNVQSESTVTNDQPITNKPNVQNESTILTVPNKPKCVIGANEKCKTCDLIQPEFCDECNDGYFLSYYEKTKCTKCSVRDCKACPDDQCLQCFDDNSEINYPLLTEEQALAITLNNMNLYKHSSKNIYCYSNSNNKLALSVILSKYYIWNNYKRKMIEISGGECSGINLVISDKNPLNNEYLQAVNQGYKFTYQDHIYEKNHKIFQYNDQTLQFNEITHRNGILRHKNIILSCEKPPTIIIEKEPFKSGPGSLCKECDQNEPYYCFLCKDGYYLLPDRITCKKCPEVGECYKYHYQIDEPNNNNGLIRDVPDDSENKPFTKHKDF